MEYNSLTKTTKNLGRNTIVEIPQDLEIDIQRKNIKTSLEIILKLILLGTIINNKTISQIFYKIKIRFLLTMFRVKSFRRIGEMVVMMAQILNCLWNGKHYRVHYHRLRDLKYKQKINRHSLNWLLVLIQTITITHLKLLLITWRRELKYLTRDIHMT